MKNTVLITGASAGIGKALAEEFARHGFNLLLVARSKDKLEQIVQFLHEQYGAEVRILPLDLLSDNAPGTILQFVEENGIEITYLMWM